MEIRPQEISYLRDQLYDVMNEFPKQDRISPFTYCIIEYLQSKKTITYIEKYISKSFIKELIDTNYKNKTLQKIKELSTENEHITTIAVSYLNRFRNELMKMDKKNKYASKKDIIKMYFAPLPETRIEPRNEQMQFPKTSLENDLEALLSDIPDQVLEKNENEKPADSLKRTIENDKLEELGPKKQKTEKEKMAPNDEIINTHYNNYY